MKLMRHSFLTLLFPGFAALLLSCSTTKVLPENQEWLAKNKVVVRGDRHYSARDLMPYIKQKENNSFLGWRPFLYIYNWQDGKGKGWDKFVTKIGDPPVVFEEGQVTASETSLENHLDYIGYYGSTVRGVIERKKPREVTVTYYVDLGRRYRIDSLAYDLPADSSFRAAFCADTSRMTVRKGSWLSENALSAEAERSSAWMRNQGYYGFSKTDFIYEADTLSRPGKAVLTVRVPRPVEKVEFGEVTLDYPARFQFNEKVLRGLNTIRPGTTYSEEVVNNTYSRLSQLQAFSAVNIETSLGEDRRVRSAVTLTRSRIQGFKVNLQASTNANWLFGISPQISYFHKNIFGGSEVLNVSLMTNHQFMFNSKVASNEVGVSLGLRIPKFVFLPYKVFPRQMPHTDIKLSFSYQQRPEYKRIIASASFGYVGNFNNLLAYQLYPLQLGVVSTPYIDDTFYKSLTNNPFLLSSFNPHFDMGLSGTLLFKTSPQAVPKTSYFYARFQLDLSGNLLSAFHSVLPKKYNQDSEMMVAQVFGMPYNQYVRGEWSFVETLRFGKDDRHALALRLLIGAGIGYGNSLSLPFEKMFYCGGASSMRGWQARTLGPGRSQAYDFFAIPSQVAGAKVELNAEYRFPIVWKLEGAAFVDVGNIFEILTPKMLQLAQSQGDPLDVSSFSFDHLENLAASWGIGLRVNLDFIVLRLDAGFRLHDPARTQRWLSFKDMFSKDGAALHFGVGYPF